jgi:SAM-dependent methyltransferase
MVRFGGLRRLTPIDRHFGLSRGTPIDRYYIDKFLGEHAGGRDHGRNPITGRVLEVGDTRYLDQFGEPGGIEAVDVLDLSAKNPKATVVADLAEAPQLSSDAYDCVICTQTLLLIYDARAAIRTLHRILRPEGILLLTAPGISQICRWEMDDMGDYWRFTTLSLRMLLEEAFGPNDLTVRAYGNVLTASAFLYGIVAEDLKTRELDYWDPDYELLIGARAIKRDESAPPR